MAPEPEGLGDRFSTKFRFIRENGDFVKMCVSPRRQHDFQGSERRKIDEKSKKIDAKCDVKNDAPKKRKKSASGSNFGALGRVRGGPGRPKSVPRAV